MNADDTEHYRQTLAANADEYYQAKFQDGEVIAGWSFTRWTLERTAAWGKRSTKGCHVARYQ